MARARGRNSPDVAINGRGASKHHPSSNTIFSLGFNIGFNIDFNTKFNMKFNISSSSSFCFNTFLRSIADNVTTAEETIERLASQQLAVNDHCVLIGF